MPLTKTIWFKINLVWFTLCSQKGNPKYAELCRGNQLICNVLVNLDHVELIINAGFTWTEIAKVFGISHSSLWRAHTCNGSRNVIIDIYTDTVDADLESVVSDTQLII